MVASIEERKRLDGQLVHRWTSFHAAPNFTFDLNAAGSAPMGGPSRQRPATRRGLRRMVDYFFATSDPIANQDGPAPMGM